MLHQNRILAPARTTDKVGVYVRNITEVCMSVSMRTNTHSPLERGVISQPLLSSNLP